MELVKNVVVDFCLFSLIEGFIFCLFFEKIGGCKKFKWYEIFLLSLGNCIISQIFPPVVYQIIAIFYMIFYLKIFKKINIIRNIKIVSISMILMMIIEMTIAMLYEILFGINFVKIDIFESFLFSIPIKIIEIYLILIFWRNNKMKMWFGQVRK